MGAEYKMDKLFVHPLTKTIAILCNKWEVEIITTILTMCPASSQIRSILNNIKNTSYMKDSLLSY